jgi:periplasmic protein CpxP/Spy
MRGPWKAGVLMLAASWCGGQNAPQSAPPPSPQDSSKAGAPQSGPRRTLEGTMELRRLTAALGLNPDQREKLRPLITDEGEQLSAVRLNEQMTPDQKKAKLQEIRESFSGQIAAVLTPEQQEKWKKMQEGPPAPASASPGAKPQGKQ